MEELKKLTKERGHQLLKKEDVKQSSKVEESVLVLSQKGNQQLTNSVRQIQCGEQP